MKETDPSKLSDIYQRIIFALTILQEATSEQIATHIKTDHDRVWKRLSELVKKGLIYKLDSKKVLRSGRMGSCYRLQEGTCIPTVESSCLKGDTFVDYSRKLDAIFKSTQLPLL